MGPITQAIYDAIKPYGTLVNEGREVRCAGSLDPDGNPIDRHLIATLDAHLPGTVAHAWGNSEFTDDLWVIEPEQTSIDWSNPACHCGKHLAP